VGLITLRIARLLLKMFLIPAS